MMALFQRAATGGQDRQDVFVLGDRAGILHHLDQPAIIPHVAESENKKFSFEVGCRCATLDPKMRLSSSLNAVERLETSNRNSLRKV